jgi:cytochrome b561
MSQQYTLQAKLVHWVSAIAIFLLFVSGVWMVDLDYYSEWYHRAPELHMSFGSLLFALTLWRLVLRKKAPTPLGSPNMVKFAKGVHHLMLTLVLLIPIAGYFIVTGDGNTVSVFRWFDIPSMGELFENQEDIAGEIHEVLAFTLMGFAGLHALAAIKHHVVDKDDTLKRMIKF